MAWKNWFNIQPAISYYSGAPSRWILHRSDSPGKWLLSYRNPTLWFQVSNPMIPSVHVPFWYPKLSRAFFWTIWLWTPGKIYQIPVVMLSNLPLPPRKVMGTLGFSPGRHHGTTKSCLVFLVDIWDRKNGKNWKHLESLLDFRVHKFWCSQKRYRLQATHGYPWNKKNGPNLCLASNLVAGEWCWF